MTAKTNLPQDIVKKREYGNVFLIIMLGVALFAALAFTVTSGLRNQNTSALSEQELVLAASDIMSYAQQVERAVDRVRRNGCSENQISFENDTDTNYTNPNAPGDQSCHVFHPDGGGISWRSPPANVNDGSQWIINGDNYIVGLDAGSVANAHELLMLLENVDTAVCTKINENLPLTLSSNPPQDDLGVVRTQRFTGTFGNANNGIWNPSGDFNRQQTFCFLNSSGDSTYFAHVLMIR